jgi:hypothetical protein
VESNGVSSFGFPTQLERQCETKAANILKEYHFALRRVEAVTRSLDQTATDAIVSGRLDVPILFEASNSFLRSFAQSIRDEFREPGLGRSMVHCRG